MPPGKVLAIAEARGTQDRSACTKAEHGVSEMKHQRHFERTSDVASRQADQIRALIANLERAVQILDCDIATEEDCAGVSDRTDAAYPILARTLAARRDNLKATAAALEKRVSGLENQTELVPELTSGWEAVKRIPLSVPAAS